MFGTNTDSSVSVGMSGLSTVVCGDHQSEKMEDDDSSLKCKNHSPKETPVSQLSDDDRNSIVFDYFESSSPREQVHKGLTHFGKPYDEDHPVESESECITRGRCVTSPSVSEMKTYCIMTSPVDEPAGRLSEHRNRELNNCTMRQNTQTADEAFPCDSDSADEPLESVVVESASGGQQASANIHKQLYSPSNNKCYGRMDKEYHTERYDCSLDGIRETKNRSVDSTVNFRLKHTSKPPFGDPLNRDKLVQSVEKLMDGRKQNDTIPNLPAAEPVSNKSYIEGSVTSQEETDRKKKKKKDKKGDGGEDENGNPPSGSEGPSFGRQQMSKFPSKLGHLMCDKDNGAETMSSTTSQQNKKNRKPKDEGIKSESVPGYVGNKPLDELLCFIDGRSNNESAGSYQKTAQQSSIVANARADPHKKSLLMAAHNSAGSLHSHQDHLAHSAQPKTEAKAKRKKKNKSGSGPTTKSLVNADKKPSHSSEGAEDDVDKDKTGEDSTSSDPLDGGTSVSSTKASSLTGEETGTSPDNPFDSTDESYIFTDLPVAQKEEQFTVVNKSKKRKKNFMSSRDLPSKDGMNLHRDDVPSRRRSRPQTRSFTPPPSTSASSKLDRSNERALSPSSFPVLGNPHEARRNSTGNLAELERSYDSDRESVKSVPPSTLADGKRSAVDISPVSYKPPSISYATIAAGRRNFTQNNGASAQEGDKPSDSNSNKLTDKADSGSSPPVGQVGVEGSEMQSTATAECPKTSCTGSRPSSASSSVRVKLSQSADTAQSSSNVPSSSDGALAAPSGGASMCSSSAGTENSNSMDATLEPHGDAIDQSDEPNSARPLSSAPVELNMNNAVDFPALPHTNSAAQLNQSSGREGAGAGPAATSLLQVQPPTQAVVASPCKVNSSKSASATCDEKKQVASNPPIVPTRNLSLKSKNKSSTKSVIFMDRRMNDQPINLDITFGFDPGFDNSVVIPVRIGSSSTCSSDSGRDTDSDNATVHLLLNKDHTAPEGISLSMEQGATVADNTGTDTTKSGSAGDSNVQCMSIRSKLQNLRRHGQLVFIGPEQPDINVPASSETCHGKLTGTPNGVVSPLIQCIQTTLPNNTIVTEKHIIVANTGKSHEDSGFKAKSTASGETKDKLEKSVFCYDRTKDPNFQSGSFNHEAGVAFLYTEWQKLENSALKYDADDPIAC